MCEFIARLLGVGLVFEIELPILLHLQGWRLGDGRCLGGDDVELVDGLILQLCVCPLAVD